MPSITPEFLASAEPVPRPRRLWPWALGLAAVLCLQVLLADRVRLSADPDWRPRLEFLCRTLRCDLPPWRQPQAFRITSRDVRPHPSVAGALLVTASFRNDARFAQTWPRLEVALSDLDGQPVGLRRFSPTEYLGSAPATDRIAPGQSASITLELVDPGKNVVAFELSFH